MDDVVDGGEIAVVESDDAVRDGESDDEIKERGQDGGNGFESRLPFLAGLLGQTPEVLRDFSRGLGYLDARELFLGEKVKPLQVLDHALTGMVRDAAGFDAGGLDRELESPVKRDGGLEQRREIERELRFRERRDE